MSRADRADWCCPQCESSDVFHALGPRFECEDCGKVVHESVGEIAAELEDLARGNDDVAAEIADRLLETGGVSGQ